MKLGFVTFFYYFSLHSRLLLCPINGSCIYRETRKTLKGTRNSFETRRFRGKSFQRFRPADLVH